MAIKKRKTVKKKATKKKIVKKKLTKRKIVKKKTIKKKTVKKKTVKKKTVAKKVVKKKTTKRKIVIKQKTNKPKKRGSFMAKRKKAKKTTRRRSSGLKKTKVTNILTNLALAIGGAIGAGFAISKLKPQIQNPKIRALIPLALGVGGALKLKKPMAQSVALGVALSGGMGLIKTQFPELPLLSGADDGDYQTSLPYEEQAMLGQDISDEDIDNMLDSEMSGIQNYAGIEEYAGNDWVSTDDM